MDYTLLKLFLGVVFTLLLYSVLYRENKAYRFAEHVFLGLAAGYTLVVVWRDILYVQWWQKMMGTVADGAAPAMPGYWVYAILLPIGLMGYTIFSKKNNWMSRIPIGIILGLWSGQQIQVWWNTYGPQILNSMRPVIPTTWESITRPITYTRGEGGIKVNLAPERVAEIQSNLYFTQALSNFIFVLTVVAAFSYFLFSFDLRGKFLNKFNTFGRWMLMIGFGAIFGSTVMARFALVIDRMSFIWQEFFGRLLTR
ncbi:MAG: hypothetical protein MUC92_06740 [Fimbriimonadaceae bacterium]|jgi:hypothetical protein|nr:hypothetical protein [Fimbriimonadaceae bacterium]